MAEKIFKGFKQVIEGTFEAENGYIYFVRNEQNSGKTDGYLVFNGKAYGTGLEVAQELFDYIGELPEGYSSIIQYFQEELSSITLDYATREELNAETIERQSADETIIEIISDINDALTEKFNQLNQNVLKEIVSGDTSVEITQKEDNKQSVSVKISEESGNTIEVKADGVYSAIYYDGDDSE